MASLTDDGPDGNHRPGLRDRQAHLRAVKSCGSRMELVQRQVTEHDEDRLGSLRRMTCWLAYE
jgi:hypothetical protein